MTLHMTDDGDVYLCTDEDDAGNTDLEYLGHIERVSWLRVPAELHEQLENLETEWTNER